MKRETPLYDFDENKFAKEDEQRKADGMSEHDRVDILLNELDEAHGQQIAADFDYRGKQAIQALMVLLCIMGFGYLIYIW